MLHYFLLFYRLDVVSGSFIFLLSLPRVCCTLSSTLKKASTQNWNQNLRYGCVIPEGRGYVLPI